MRRIKALRASGAVVVFLGAHTLGVSVAGLASGTRAGGGIDSTQQQPSFRAVTAFVEVDAIVKDRNGKFTPDLSSADFEVLEDGVPQRVEQMYVVLGPSVKTVAPVAGASPAPSALPAAPAPQTQRTFVFLFDQEHMQPGGFDRARKAALEFLRNNFRQGDIGGVVNGGMMVNNRLTNVRAELEAAVSSIKPADEVRALLITMREWPRLVDSFEVYQIADRNDREAISRAVTRACSEDPGSCKRMPVDQMVQDKARRLIDDLRAAGMRTMHAVAGLANGLAKLPGRKTIILLSDGFFAEDSWANLRQVVDLATRAAVRVYALDTRGLNRGSAGSDIIDAPPGSANPFAQSAGFDTVSDGLNSLAVDTGGLMIRNENDFAKALDEIASDTSSYYILGYRSTNTKLDGTFRQIAVRVKRPGLTVRARKGYLATASTLPVQTGPVEPSPAAPATPPAAAAPPAAADKAGIAGAAPPATAPPAAADAALIRAQPDMKDRLAALGKIAPDTTRSQTGAPPEQVLAQARAGWDAYQRGDVNGAQVALSAAARHPAAPPWVHYTLGWTEFAVSDFVNAAGEWERVRAAVPEFEAVYFDLADSYLQQREFGQAIAVLREAEKRWPKDVEVYNAIGSIQAGRGALDEAIKTFEKAVAVNLNDAAACYNLAKTSELRFVQSQRFRGLRAAYNLPAIFADRDRAVEYYQRTIALGGPFVEQAKEGLKRLGAQ
jgi:VWFA-related protein